MVVLHIGSGGVGDPLLVWWYRYDIIVGDTRKWSWLQLGADLPCLVEL